MEFFYGTCLPLHLVGEKVSFRVGSESESRLRCLLAVTLGRFLDSQAFGLLCTKWGSNGTYFLGL